MFILCFCKLLFELLSILIVLYIFCRQNDFKFLNMSEKLYCTCAPDSTIKKLERAASMFGKQYNFLFQKQSFLQKSSVRICLQFFDFWPKNIAISKKKSHPLEPVLILSIFVKKNWLCFTQPSACSIENSHWPQAFQRYFKR